MDTAELLKLARQGDREALEAFFKQYERLVWMWVNKVCRFDKSYHEDIFQAGCMGLLKALNGFDDSRDIAFSSYAIPFIRGAVVQEMHSITGIGLSERVSAAMHSLKKWQNQYAIINGREPSTAELAAHFGFSKKKVIALLGLLRETLSLDNKLKDAKENVFEYRNCVTSKFNYDHIVDKIIVNDAMKRLTAEERLVIFRTFWDGENQIKIAKEIRTSQATISRIKAQALTVMRGYLEEIFYPRIAWRGKTWY
jgi:RNA polymerase sporulation-specific sigma factor